MASRPMPMQRQAGVGLPEASNVNAVEEMTSVLALSKQFELHIKMMNSAKEGDQAMARVLQSANHRTGAVKQAHEENTCFRLYGLPKPACPPRTPT
jgi:ubiquinone biosynthesis protein Coq4